MAVRKSAGTVSKSSTTPSRAAQEEVRFVYRGNASGASARFVRVDPLKGLDHVIPVQAASSLPVIGGRSESKVSELYTYEIDNPDPKDKERPKLPLFSLEGVYTLAENPLESRGVWRTHVHSEAHGLNILGRTIRVGDVVADINSEHRRGEDFPRITLGDCAIAGMELSGFPVEVAVNLRFFRSVPTYEALEGKVREDKELARRTGWRYGKPRQKGVAECHIIESVKFPKGLPPEAEYDPAYSNRIVWNGVGTIYLGELLVSPLARRLTMLRVMLGSPVGGMCDAGEVETDGHTMP